MEYRFYVPRTANSQSSSLPAIGANSTQIQAVLSGERAGVVTAFAAKKPRNHLTPPPENLTKGSNPLQGEILNDTFTD
jgi:hypothetical protein